MCMYKYGNDIIFIIHSGIKGLIFGYQIIEEWGGREYPHLFLMSPLNGWEWVENMFNIWIFIKIRHNDGNYESLMPASWFIIMLQ